jgi:hypothetical protein
VAQTLEISLEDVVAAGRVLFGPGFVADGLGWREALKTTYRRRALETHPDRARAVGRSESELAREFKKVGEAYRVLSALCAGPLPPPAAPRAHPAAPHAHARPAASRARPRPAAAPRSRPSSPPPPSRPPSAREPARAAQADTPAARVRVAVRPEDLPRRRLRFAEYLYYSGRVPWTAFVEAIAWQRGQRPAVGRIAIDWGFLTAEDVAQILERRRVAAAQGVPFGEFAVRLGYLTSFQLLALLGRQLRLQRRIGEFFVERGYLERDEIDELRRRIVRHNARWNA